MTTHLVQFSTGLTSAEVAYRVVQQHGPDDVVLLFADTLVEDEDNYRFGEQVAALLGVAITRLADGRTPMQVGRDARVVPNNRFAVCSRVLKRDLLRGYMDANHDPATSIVYLGFGWDEQHRFDRARPHWSPWTVEAPLTVPPFVGHGELLQSWRERGIEPPRLYGVGYGHANCGGACVRGGAGSWSTLLDWHRDRFLQWENEEEQTRAMLGKDVAILTESIRGRRRPLPLRVLRERIEAQPGLFIPDGRLPCHCGDFDDDTADQGPDSPDLTYDTDPDAPVTTEQETRPDAS